jgi:hypothetical protein
MPTGYCTVTDVRRALLEAGFDGALAEDNNQAAVNKVAAVSTAIEKELSRHFYDANATDPHNLLPTSTKTRDDEASIPTGGAFLAGEPATPKAWQGSYTRLDLDRRDADSVSELLVKDPGGGYTDWVADTSYTGGSWPSALGDDYYLRVNNSGDSYLYLDSQHFLDADGEPLLESFANAVYLTWAYGRDGIPDPIREAAAMRAAAKLLAPDDDASLGIPENANLQTVETKVSALERQAGDLLEEYK